MDSERKWLKDCFSRILREKVSWLEDGEDIRKECRHCLMVHYLGGDLVLIQSVSNESVVNKHYKWKEWTAKWFELTKPWSEKDSS